MTAHRADGIPTTGTNVDADTEVRVQLKDQQETGHCGAVRRGHADCGLCMVLVLPVRGSWLGQDRGNRGSETWSHSR